MGCAQSAEARPGGLRPHGKLNVLQPRGWTHQPPAEAGGLPRDADAKLRAVHEDPHKPCSEPEVSQLSTEVDELSAEREGDAETPDLANLDRLPATPSEVHPRVERPSWTESEDPMLSEAPKLTGVPVTWQRFREKPRLGSPLFGPEPPPESPFQLPLALPKTSVLACLPACGRGQSVGSEGELLETMRVLDRGCEEEPVGASEQERRTSCKESL